MNAQQQRPLKINLGAVKRLTKEKTSYEAELADAQSKVASSTFEPGSPEQRRLTGLREEAETTLRDVERRLEDFKGKLRAALAPVADQFPDDELVVEAKTVLAQ
jgi:hypothetical protein